MGGWRTVSYHTSLPHVSMDIYLITAVLMYTYTRGGTRRGMTNMFNDYPGQNNVGWPGDGQRLKSGSVIV